MSVSADEQTRSSLSSINQDIAPIALTQDQSVKVQELQENSGNLSVRWDQIDATPKWVRMTNFEMNWRSEDYSERAYQFLEEYGVLYQMGIISL